MKEIMDTKEDLELMAAEPACECRRVDVDVDDPRDCELHNGAYEARMEAARATVVRSWPTFTPRKLPRYAAIGNGLFVKLGRRRAS